MSMLLLLYMFLSSICTKRQVFHYLYWLSASGITNTTTGIRTRSKVSVLRHYIWCRKSHFLLPFLIHLKIYYLLYRSDLLLCTATTTLIH